MPYEATIDLDSVNRQLLQRAQARIPRANVIDLDVHAIVAQSLQRLGMRLRILHEGALGDLQSKLMRLQSGLAQNGPDKLSDGLALELHGREIDGNANDRNVLLPPAHHLLTDIP